MKKEQTELEHIRCARMTRSAGAEQRLCYRTELEHTRCARILYQWEKGILCNRIRAYKMRAHALPQDKCVSCVTELENTLRCARMHYPRTNGYLM